MADNRASWRSDALGEAKEVQTDSGRLRYFERGTGPAIVFVHGVLVNANLWRKVVPALAKDFRCVTLDLPLGSSEIPMSPDADLSPPALADLIADAIEGIGLEDVTLVGNDTGGALCQILVTRRPERIGKVVLTPCDAFDNFFPTLFRFVLAPAYLPGGLMNCTNALRIRALRRLPVAFGWLTKRPVDSREAEDSYVYPSLTNKGARRDGTKAVRKINKRYTLDAAERFHAFDKPVLLAWSSEDKVFPPEHAERMAKLFPDARIEWIDDSYSFSPEDRPDRVAEAIADFARERVPAGAS